MWMMASFANSSTDTAPTSFMKESDGHVPLNDRLDLDLPDWSGMVESADRITPEAALRLNGLYPLFFAATRLEKSRPLIKPPLPEFEL
jgi:hypothetical protein